MKKVYVSKTYNAVGKTPDECLARAIETFSDELKEKCSPIAVVKVGKTLWGRSAVEYKGLYKEKDGQFTKIRQMTIYGYKL